MLPLYTKKVCIIYNAFCEEMLLSLTLPRSQPVLSRCTHSDVIDDIITTTAVQTNIAASGEIVQLDKTEQNKQGYTPPTTLTTHIVMKILRVVNFQMYKQTAPDISNQLLSTKYSKSCAFCYFSFRKSLVLEVLGND